MTETLASLHPWLKALHIIAVIAWMAAMLYLPRLYVYHCVAEPGSELSETLKVMERRLLRAIMTPAMIAAWLFGGLLMATAMVDLGEGWLHAKIVLVVAMTGMHGLMAGWRRDFAADANRRPQRFYRVANEVLTLLMIAIVIVVVVRPF